MKQIKIITKKWSQILDQLDNQFFISIRQWTICMGTKQRSMNPMQYCIRGGPHLDVIWDATMYLTSHNIIYYVNYNKQ